MTGDGYLTVQNLHISYGGAKAVTGISFQVHRGEIVTLIGANGAGKSSIMHAISGIVPVDSGEILFDGASIVRSRPHRIVSEGLVQVPEGRMIFTGLTVAENLALGGYRRKQHLDSAMEAVLSHFPVLQEKRSDSAADLSGGQLQMLALARSLMAEPKLLLLDEPSLGLDPITTASLFRLIANLRSQGVTILLVEQNVNKALKLADRAYLLESGRIVREGPAADLASDPHIVTAYLGDLSRKHLKT